MNLNKNTVKLLRMFGQPGKDELEFQQCIKQYQEFHQQDRSFLERILLEKEQLYKFKISYNQFDQQTKMADVNIEKILYFLEKNFILHRYAGDYSYMNMQDVNHLFRHYQLLLTRNFEDISLSLDTNNSLKYYLANQYVHTLYSNENLIKEIITKHPEKIEEVTSLLIDYNAYHMKAIEVDKTKSFQPRKEHPLIYTKKISTIK